MADDNRDLAACDVPELLALFVATLHEFENIDHTNRKNRIYAKRGRILAAIKARSDGTVRALLPFLSDPDPMVRYLSATYYREVDHAAHLKILEELASPQRRDWAQRTKLARVVEERRGSALGVDPETNLSARLLETLWSKTATRDITRSTRTDAL